MTKKFPGMRPAFPFIALDGNGRPSLVALRCRTCGTCYGEQNRLACARCGARADSLESMEPGYTGTLHSTSIVYRTYPGIPAPFISAVVDLDNGPTIKGILRGVDFNPEEIPAGRPVRVVFDEALGRTDSEGNRYVSHFFEPL